MRQFKFFFIKTHPFFLYIKLTCHPRCTSLVLTGLHNPKSQSQITHNSFCRSLCPKTLTAEKIFQSIIKLLKLPEVAMDIIPTPPPKVFKTPSWNNLMNEISNTHDDEDIASVSSDFL